MPPIACFERSNYLRVPTSISPLPSDGKVAYLYPSVAQVRWATPVIGWKHVVQKALAIDVVRCKPLSVCGLQWRMRLWLHAAEVRRPGDMDSLLYFGSGHSPDHSIESQHPACTLIYIRNIWLAPAVSIISWLVRSDHHNMGWPSGHRWWWPELQSY